jgi:hypothetical protein
MPTNMKLDFFYLYLYLFIQHFLFTWWMYSRVVPGDPNELTWLSLKYLPYFTAYQLPNVAYMGSVEENMDRAYLKGNWLYLTLSQVKYLTGPHV